MVNVNLFGFYIFMKLSSWVFMSNPSFVEYFWLGLIKEICKLSLVIHEHFSQQQNKFKSKIKNCIFSRKLKRTGFNVFQSTLILLCLCGTKIFCVLFNILFHVFWSVALTQGKNLQRIKNCNIINITLYIHKEYQSCKENLS